MATLPKHIAIIMDGSGRWAQKRMLPRIAGHSRGVEATRAIVKRCVDINIPILTIFAFSSENWQRPAAEVKSLMGLLQNLLQTEVHQLHANGIKLNVIGDLAGLDTSLQESILKAQELTINNIGLQLNIALNYGGRWDIVQAAREMCKEVISKKIDINSINEAVFSQHIALHNIPDPDLLIRTSGEQRISNFLLWQIAYTEIYFCQTLWPDFSEHDLELALNFYAQRQRRFGTVTDPLQKVDNV